ncbi:YkvI family membrane protein [Pseudobacillus wudalianchiensis]|uniref:YkvI family membrane protein n=1 Tax=Pseudobacillus wudalianchiensis TaxID=1743143 RepID=UPI00316AD89A
MALKTWGGACQIAAVYVGTIIGAGFATGKEIVQFFSQFGFYGLFGIIISGCLFIFLGAKIMLVAMDVQAKSFEEFNAYLFGERFGLAATFIQFFMLIGVTGVMLSGTGALFSERFHIPANAGILLTIVIGFLVMKKGVTGLLAVNVFVVPLMIVFHLYTASEAIAQPDFLENLFMKETSHHTWKVWTSPFSYAAFNLALAQAVLVPLAFEIKDRQTIKKGAFLGGVVLTCLMIASHVSLIQLADVAKYDIPMAQIVEKLIPAFHFIYAFLIYGEIFTSVIGNAYGLKQQLENHIRWPASLLFLLIFSAGFLLSQVSYGTLLGFLYPLFGMISLLFLLLLWKK